MGRYLFMGTVERACKAEPTNHNFLHVKRTCVAKGKELWTNHPRAEDDLGNVAAGQALANTMGTKSRTPGNPWWGDYYENSRQVSDNVGVIRQMVVDEIYMANQLGIDISAIAAIGGVYNIAPYVWSEMYGYNSPAQNEGRR